jgi:hypothetical protein
VISRSHQQRPWNPLNTQELPKLSPVPAQKRPTWRKALGVRFPDPSAETVWARAHDCVNALHALVRKVDLSCSEAEKNAEISVSGIARRRAKLCERTLIQLANFKPFETAERAFQREYRLAGKAE